MLLFPFPCSNGTQHRPLYFWFFPHPRLQSDPLELASNPLSARSHPKLRLWPPFREHVPRGAATGKASLCPFPSNCFILLQQKGQIQQQRFRGDNKDFALHLQVQTVEQTSHSSFVDTGTHDGSVAPTLHGSTVYWNSPHTHTCIRSRSGPNKQEAEQT